MSLPFLLLLLMGTADHSISVVPFRLFYNNGVLRLFGQIFDTHPVTLAGKPRCIAYFCFNNLTVLRRELDVVGIAVVGASVIVSGFVFLDTGNDGVSLNAVLFGVIVAFYGKTIAMMIAGQ